jgi:GrpB-like predicted nucleotidyltransferase (UPF0157 family)
MDPLDPAHTNDTVVMVDPDASWPRLFEEERARLTPALAPFARSIEHIGSTAIPGLCAKPIIDLLVTVEPLGPAQRYAAVLIAFGYVLRADTAQTERYAFGKRDAQGKRLVPGYNLHVVQHGGGEHQRHVAFRDYLQTHPDARRAYGDLKRRLAVAYAGDRDGYTQAKSAFVRSIEALALSRQEPPLAASSGIEES